MVRAERTRAMHHHICTAVRASEAHRTIFSQSRGIVHLNKNDAEMSVFARGISEAQRQFQRCLIFLIFFARGY